MQPMDAQMFVKQKQIQRRAGQQARRALTLEQRTEYSRRICRSVQILDAFQQAKNVLTYAAFGAEASVDGLLKQQLEKRFFWPVCLPDVQMTAARPLKESGWEVGQYGIRTPVAEQSELIAPEELDLVLVPCTAFDSQCRRIGMGKGYYDRYLARCVNAVKVGIAFECQRAERAAVEGHDWPLDWFVTEQCIYQREE